jgi:hypothetical protein
MRYIKTGSGLIFSAMMFMSLSVFGQNKADSLNPRHQENVTVYGTSKPVIQKAYKINQKPALPKVEVPPVTFTDDFTGQELPTSIILQPIKPTLITEEIKNTSWNNVLRLGAGSQISPYAEFFHSSGVESSYRFNVHLYHYSSFANISNYLPSPYSNTSAEVDFEKYFDYHILGFKAAYKLNSNRYYGHETSNDTVPFIKSDNRFKQRYQEGSFAIDYASTYRNFDKLHHHIHAATYYIWDLRNTSELFAGLNFDVHKAFEVYNVFNHQQLGIEGNYSLYQEKTNLGQNRDNYIAGMPYFDAKYGMVSFRAGVNVQWLMSYDVKLHFYPYLDAKLNVIPQRFTLFGGVKGGLKKNSLQALSEENPFLLSYNNAYRWQNNKLQFYGGFKGNIAKKLDFEVRAGYQTFQDMAFFDYPLFSSADSTLLTGPNPLSYLNAFNVKYASGNLMAFSAGLTFVNSSTVKIWLLGNYNHYNLDGNFRPLYKPLKEVRFGCSIRMSGKFRPWIEAYYMGSRWASHQLTSSGTGSSSYFYELPAYYNINFGSDYQISTQLSAFLKVTNLLDKKYLQFNEYPVKGLEIMVGAGYRF